MFSGKPRECRQFEFARVQVVHQDLEGRWFDIREPNHARLCFLSLAEFILLVQVGRCCRDHWRDIGRSFTTCLGRIGAVQVKVDALAADNSSVQVEFIHVLADFDHEVGVLIFLAHYAHERRKMVCRHLCARNNDFFGMDYGRRGSMSRCRWLRRARE